MKTKLLIVLLALAGAVQAQDDPTVMLINGQPVSRSEFEYSYNKNNSEGVIDKKNVNEYVDLFVNYKLKVAAALDAGLDTMTTFRDEFRSYRDQQVRPTLITEEDVEREARSIYEEAKQRVDAGGGLINAAHILIAMNQKASQQDMDAAKLRADSVYNALKKGADFAELAKKLSDDKGSGAKGGALGWLQRGVTVKEFEEAAYALKVGELSQPVQSPFGYHIIKMLGKQMFFPYDSVRHDILSFIESRNLREKIINDKLNMMAAAKGNGATPQTIIDEKVQEMENTDPELKYLIREYHDGLLCYEITNRHVWEKASKDQSGLANYFKKNKEKYKWESPRYKGIAYHVKDAKDVKAVKNCVKNQPFDKWADRLRDTFNNDSVIRIRVEKGIFKEGDSKLVDREIFKKDVTVTPVEGYPIDAVFGKKLKAPETYEDVRGLVVADYQEELEKKWVEELRRKYPVVIYEEVLKTVNKH